MRKQFKTINGSKIRRVREREDHSAVVIVMSSSGLLAGFEMTLEPQCTIPYLSIALTSIGPKKGVDVNEVSCSKLVFYTMPVTLP